MICLDPINLKNYNLYINLELLNECLNRNYINLILSFVKTFIFKTDKNTENKKYKHKLNFSAFFDYFFLFQPVAVRGIALD